MPERYAEPVSMEATIIMLQERLAVMTEERDWLYERCEWLEWQEAKAWAEVRRLESLRR